MGRALAAVGGLLVLCFAILGIVVYATRSEDRVAVDQVLAENLSRAFTLAGGGPDPVEVDVVTDFAWDELLVVEPDTSRAAIDHALGFVFKGDLPYDAESQELFIFVRDGGLARFADYRGRDRFDGLERPIARFTPGTAIFTVRDAVIRPAS
jgi:hypothetical protein